MKACKLKGICCNCDENSTKGHHCTQYKLYLLDVVISSDEEYAGTKEELKEDTKSIKETQILISYSALVDISTPQTLKVYG